MTTTAELDLKFPVLGIGPDDDVWGFPDLRSLTTCGPRTLKKEMQSGLELVDSRCRRWRVVTARKLGQAGSPLSWLLRTLMFAVPQFRVEQTVEPMPSVTLDEVQARVCKCIEAHPDFWCEEEDRGAELPPLLSKVRATKSIRAIHEALGLDTFEAY